MSYILNALRKSERERQAIEPDSVTHRIAVHQVPHHRSSIKLIVVLLSLNLAILVYFLGFAQKTPSQDAQQTAAIVKPDASPAEPISPPLPAIKPAVPRTPPIAKINENRNVPLAAPPPAKIQTLKKQTIEPVKPATAQPQPVKTIALASAKPGNAPSPQVGPDEHAVAPLQGDLKPVEPAKNAVEKPPPVQIKDDLPFLEELPAEMSRSLPHLPINVFSYSSTPADRFVMIDMVKYIPGQSIKDQLELKEIREDSIVVGYDKVTFKIRRP